MIVGNPSIFAIESSITTAYDLQFCRFRCNRLKKARLGKPDACRYGFNFDFLNGRMRRVSCKIKLRELEQNLGILRRHRQFYGPQECGERGATG